MYHSYFGGAVADAFSYLAAEKVEVVRGSQSLIYGSNAMGGVVNILTQGLEQSGGEIELDASLGSYGTFQTGFTGKARQRGIGLLASIDYQRSDGHRQNMHYDRAGGFAKLELDFTKELALWGTVHLNRFRASNPGPTFNPINDNDQSALRGSFTVGVKNEFKTMHGDVAILYDWGNLEINPGYHDGEYRADSLFHNRDYLIGLTGYEVIHTSGNQITVGGDFKRVSANTWHQALRDEEEGDRVKHGIGEFGIYGNFHRDFSAQLTVDAGLRLEYHTKAQLAYAPQGGFIYRVNKTTSVRGTIGRGYRNPSLYELFGSSVKNDALKPEANLSTDLGFRQSQNRGDIVYDVTFFFIKGLNRIEVKDREGDLKLDNTGKFANVGGEATFSYKINRNISTGLNYTFLHTDKERLVAPQHKMNFDFSYVQDLLTIRTDVTLIGKLCTNTETKKKETFVNWNLDAQYKLTKVITAFLRGENIIARRYQMIDGYPMPKATVIAGITLKVDTSRQRRGGRYN